MAFSSKQIRHARELARERRKHGAIQRLLIDEFNLRPALLHAVELQPQAATNTTRRAHEEEVEALGTDVAGGDGLGS